MRKPTPIEPVEGVDYYMEDERLVFTETYHLKRGYCCNSRCRHCPYRQASEISQSTYIVISPAKLKLP